MSKTCPRLEVDGWAMLFRYLEQYRSEKLFQYLQRAKATEYADVHYPPAYCVPKKNTCGSSIAIRRYQSGGVDYYVGGDKLDIPGFQFKEILCYAWPAEGTVVLQLTVIPNVQIHRMNSL